MSVLRLHVSKLKKYAGTRNKPPLFVLSLFHELQLHLGSEVSQTVCLNCHKHTQADSTLHLYKVHC